MEQRNLCFLTLLRDAVTGVFSPEAMALTKDMDRTLQDQVLELARLHNLFPLLAEQLMRLHPPGLEQTALRACVMEALVRQTMATQSLLTLTRALEQAGVPALVVKGAVCRSLYKRRKTQRIRCEPGIETSCGWSSTGAFAEL